MNRKAMKNNTKTTRIHPMTSPVASAFPHIFGPFNVGHGLWVEQALVTPELAAAWLEDVPNARRIDENRVARYAADLRQGAWRMTGETLRFDWNDSLLNGHHRLRAITRAGVSAWLLIVRGVDPTTKETQDTGLPKRLSDWSERTNATAGYAISAALLRLLTRDYNLASIPRLKEQTWDIVGDDHIQFAASVKGSRLSHTAPFRMACALLHRLDPPRSEQFRERISKFEFPSGSVEQVYARQFSNAGTMNVLQHSVLAARAAMAAARGEAPKVLREPHLEDVVRVLRLEKIVTMIEDERAAMRVNPARGSQ